MIFICSFLVLFIIFVVFMLLFTSGFIVFSGCGKITPKPVNQPVSNQSINKPKIPTPKKAYIDLNGRLIELQSKAEETEAKKDGYNVVYK